jgi:quercetin dioxygenase-like cupin family protein
MTMHRRAQTVTGTKGSPDYFTGGVDVMQLVQPAVPSRVAVALVTFQSGARTHWHTHPLGQTIVVTEGEGQFQLWGRPIQHMGQGDVVTFAPGIKHWHGATATSPMSHIAIHEVLDGASVTWLEAAIDDQAAC